MRNFPAYVQLYPTLRCNQSCSFCFNKTMPAMPDMAPPDCRRMISRLQEIGTQAIDIMGGEPTLYADLAGLLRDARREGLAVNISSNGSDQNLLAAVMERFPEVAVGISINSRRELARLALFIGKHRPVVKSVFGAPPDEELISEVLAVHPKRFYLLYRDALELPDLGSTVPFDQYRDIVMRMQDRAGTGMVYCSGFLPDTAQYPELQHVRCPAGTTKLGIMPDGSVYPCNLFFGRECFRLGNILTDPFERIWRHPALAFFRSFSGNSCPRKSCSLHRACHGGCPAHSYILRGALAAPDPRCVPALQGPPSHLSSPLEGRGTVKSME